MGSYATSLSTKMTQYRWTSPCRHPRLSSRPAAVVRNAVPSAFTTRGMQDPTSRVLIAGAARRVHPRQRLAVRVSAAEGPAGGSSPDVPKDVSKIQNSLAAASQSLQSVAAKLDLTQLVQYNFAVQVVLAAVSWGILFFTTHGAIASGAKVGPSTIILIFSVLLTAYSAFISFGYFKKVQLDGHSVLSGWKQLKNFYDHITINFVGALFAIVSLQASVGGQVVESLTSSASSFITHKVAAGANVGLQFLAQAAANTLLAHIVSILFLTLLLKKTTDSYQSIIEFAEKLKGFTP